MRHAAGCERGADALQQAVLRVWRDVVNNIQDGDHIHLAEIGSGHVALFDVGKRMLVTESGGCAGHIPRHQLNAAQAEWLGGGRPVGRL